MVTVLKALGSLRVSERARRDVREDLLHLGGRKTAQEKKNKFLGTDVPRNFSDQCSLDFASFLCLFSGRRAKSSQELCSWEPFFLILGGFSPSEYWRIGHRILNAPLRGLLAPSQSPSQSACCLSELRALLPLMVLPLEACTSVLSSRQTLPN